MLRVFQHKTGVLTMFAVPDTWGHEDDRGTVAVSALGLKMKFK